MEKAGEDVLVNQLQQIFHRTNNAETLVGIGDDCALFIPSTQTDDSRVLISTDVLVEDVHFKLKWITPQQLAQRAFVQNLADISACSGRSTGIVVGLVLPNYCNYQWMFDFATALADICQKHDVAVLGGDLSGGTTLIISLTIVGTLDKNEFVKRSTAQVGDIVALSGRQGYSHSGLEQLTRTDTVDDSPQVQRYLTPQPPFQAGIRAGLTGVHAMMDVSDGLIKDAFRLAKASGVTIELFPDPNVYTEVGLENYYLGGEDHSLLATFAPDSLLPDEFVPIGRVNEFAGQHLVGKDIDQLQGKLLWDHFGAEYV